MQTDDYTNLAQLLVADNTNESNEEFARIYKSFMPEPRKIFITAVQHGNLPVVTLFYELGFDINDASDGCAPLEIAFKTKNLKIIRLMLRMTKININILMRDTNKSILYYALEEEMPIDIIVRMMYYLPVMNYSFYNPLSIAVSKNNIEAIQLLIYFGADTKFMDINNRIAADYAVSEEIRQALIDWTSETTTMLRSLATNDKKVLLQQSTMFQALNMEMAEFLHSAFIV